MSVPKSFFLNSNFRCINRRRSAYAHIYVSDLLYVTVCFVFWSSEITTLSNAIGGESFNNTQTADIEELTLESLLDAEDLIEFMTIYDNIEVKGEAELLRADLIREDLKFTTSMEQYYPRDGQGRLSL
ncbi:hypothetical protein TNCV_4132821 [Trichonephila clavipes]|nr:hypothetical protein TNCV_4132821 [Trichonephila clavipes]